MGNGEESNRVATVFDPASTARLLDLMSEPTVASKLADAILEILGQHGFELGRTRVLVLEPEVRNKVWQSVVFPSIEEGPESASGRVFEEGPDFKGLIMNRDD